MTKRLLTGLVFVLVQLAGAQMSGLEGRWDGAIELPGSPLEIGVTFRSGAGVIDVPTQGIIGAPLQNVQLDGRRAQFVIAEMPGISGEPTFRGRLAGDALSGTFSQSGETFAFSLTRQVALPASEHTAVLARGRMLTVWFYERDLGRLYGAFSVPYKKVMDREALRALRQRVGDQAGNEVGIERETVSRREGLLVYTRTATFDNFLGAVDVTWILDARGEVAQFSISARQDGAVEAPSERLDYRTKTAL